jgi:hypothetical protein
VRAVEQFLRGIEAHQLATSLAAHQTDQRADRLPRVVAMLGSNSTRAPRRRPASCRVQVPPQSPVRLKAKGYQHRVTARSPWRSSAIVPPRCRHTSRSVGGSPGSPLFPRELSGWGSLARHFAAATAARSDSSPSAIYGLETRRRVDADSLRVHAPSTSVSGTLLTVAARRSAGPGQKCAGPTTTLQSRNSRWQTLTRPLRPTRPPPASLKTKF